VENGSVKAGFVFKIHSTIVDSQGFWNFCTEILQKLCIICQVSYFAQFHGTSCIFYLNFTGHCLHTSNTICFNGFCFLEGIANISFSYTSSKALSVDGFCFVLALQKFAQAALMEEANI
jgi:hypothetical protein